MRASCWVMVLAPVGASPPTRLRVAAIASRNGLIPGWE